MRALLYAYLLFLYYTQEAASWSLLRVYRRARVYVYVCVFCLRMRVSKSRSRGVLQAGFQPTRVSRDGESTGRSTTGTLVLVVGYSEGAGPCSPRWSIGAAAVDEVEEDEGGKKKGRSVREKVEETLTRRPVGVRVGYFGIPGAGCPGKETTDADTDEEACEERSVTETNDQREG